MDMREKLASKIAQRLRASLDEAGYPHVPVCIPPGGPLIDAVLDALAEPDEAMVDIMLDRMGCSHLKKDAGAREGRIEEWRAVLTAARNPPPGFVVVDNGGEAKA